MSRDELDPIWKALADPTRRRILDMLRESPRTTGDLCVPFKLSRFAIMKHLTILEEAGLVMVRRQGRERWNHLNVTPIQQVHERWVKPYEARWAASLLRLKEHLQPETQGANMPAQAATDFGAVQIDLEIAIKAKPQRVWQALVEETSRWWLKDFYSRPEAKGFIIEPRLGGHAYEDCGESGGQVWYTVVGLEPHKSLSLLGHLIPAFGGPAMTMLQLRLVAKGKGTTLQLSDAILGKVGEGKLTQTRDGWRMLFEDGLRAYVEGAA
jgi:DNA-binding transcriptional ArsR family regulator